MKNFQKNSASKLPAAVEQGAECQQSGDFCYRTLESGVSEFFNEDEKILIQEKLKNKSMLNGFLFLTVSKQNPADE
jgi:ribosome-associated protein